MVISILHTYYSLTVEIKMRKIAFLASLYNNVTKNILLEMRTILSIDNGWLD